MSQWDGLSFDDVVAGRAPGREPLDNRGALASAGDEQNASFLQQATMAAATKVQDRLVASPTASMLATVANLSLSVSSARRARVMGKLGARHFSGLSAAVVRDFLEAHWLALSAAVGVTVAAVTVTNGLAAAAVAAACTVLAVDATLTGLEIAVHHGRRWVELASAAHGDEQKLDEACEEYLLMAFSIAGAGLQAANLKYRVGHASGAAPAKSASTREAAPVGELND